VVKIYRAKDHYGHTIHIFAFSEQHAKQQADNLFGRGNIASLNEI